MIIEKAQKKDLAEILNIQKKAFIIEAEIYGDFDIAPLTQTMESIAGDFESQMYLKAVINGLIVGSVRGYESEGTCYIGRVIVLPDFQNKGIGAALVKEIESAFGSCRRFELFTGCKSEKNIYLYEKLGYRKFKTEKISDALSMVYLEKIKD